MPITQLTANALTMRVQYLILLSALFMNASLAEQEYEATSAPTSTPYDCTTVVLDEVDESQLTKQERIARMEQELVSSVDTFNTCIDKSQAVITEQIGSGSGSGSGMGLDSEDLSSQSDMDGDRGDISSNSSNVSNSTNATEEQLSSERSHLPSEDTLASGRGDEVIPPKDNDSIVCEILYEEISNEIDVKKRAQLSKQYKEYNCG